MLAVLLVCDDPRTSWVFQLSNLSPPILFPLLRYPLLPIHLVCARLHRNGLGSLTSWEAHREESLRFGTLVRTDHICTILHCFSWHWNFTMLPRIFPITYVSWRRHCVTVDLPGGWRLFCQVLIKSMTHTRRRFEYRGWCWRKKSMNACSSLKSVGNLRCFIESYTFTV